MATLKKGSAAAKAFMAKIRAAKGKTKVKAKAKTKVGMNKTENDIKVTSNVKNRTFTIKKNGITYRTGKFNKAEFEENEYNTQGDWANFLRTQDFYYQVKTGAAKKVGAVKKVMPAKKASSMHKDTKSHNVNIRVVSGVNGIKNQAFNEIEETKNLIVEQTLLLESITKAYKNSKSIANKKALMSDIKTLKNIFIPHNTKYLKSLQMAVKKSI